MKRAFSTTSERFIGFGPHPPEFRAPQNAVFGANIYIFENAVCSILLHKVTETEGRRGNSKGYWVSIAPGPGPTFAEVADIAGAYGRLRPGLALSVVFPAGWLGESENGGNTKRNRDLICYNMLHPRIFVSVCSIWF